MGYDYIEVISDGTKTYRQLYNELFAKIDWNRINYHSIFVTIVGSTVYIFYVSTIQTNESIKFVNLYSDSVTYSAVHVSISAVSYHVTYSQARNTNFTYADGSTQVALSNRQYRIYYR